jgi:hypothetical protein
MRYLLKSIWETTSTTRIYADLTSMVLDFIRSA